MFPIYYDNEQWGSATVEEQGLYCRILCKCRCPTKSLYRIYLYAEDLKINLGTCIKRGNVFTVDTKIASKQIKEKKIRFQLEPNHNQSSQFYPIKENTPFPYLWRLDKARMRYRNNQVGVTFTD